jgi:alkylhydroperoxidase/carboxymuconolactone decarboxylase family protein YurZ
MHKHETEESWIDIDPDTGPLPAAPGNWTFEFRPAMGRLLSAHPTIGPAFNTLYSEIMRSPGHLSRQEREMIATVASAAQDCEY